MLLRVFGAGTDAFLDRATETAALLELNASGLGATCLGVFANGRLERFMRRRRPLAPAETAEPATERRIAAELARFHASKVVAAGWDAARDRAPAPQTWDVLRGWIERIREAGEQDAGPDASAAATRKTTLRRRLRLDDLREDVDELERRSVESGAPCVYLHNDLLGGNILVAEDDAAPATPGDDDSRPRDRGSSSRDDEDGGEDESVRERTTRGDDPNVSSASKSREPSVAFIDFEYACYGPRGFDVANHLIERAGFECDWSRLPDAAARLRSRAYADASTAASTEPPSTTRERGGGGAAGGGGGGALPRVAPVVGGVGGATGCDVRGGVRLRRVRRAEDRRVQGEEDGSEPIAREENRKAGQGSRGLELTRGIFFYTYTRRRGAVSTHGARPSPRLVPPSTSHHLLLFPDAVLFAPAAASRSFASSLLSLAFSRSSAAIRRSPASALRSRSSVYCAFLRCDLAALSRFFLCRSSPQLLPPPSPCPLALLLAPFFFGGRLTTGRGGSSSAAADLPRLRPARGG